MSTLELETTTIDEVFWGSNGLNTDIDYLQIYVQGGEIPVLEGASRCLSSVLATAVEVDFMQVYTNKPLFSDVDIHLTKKGFSLFDLVGIKLSLIMNK
ncbi:FkbM family methyltransferase [Microcoleus sp. T3_A4]|uniref:FkbM family methyltransferase n=1 Tax=Microcoleus sp. T3_A4 TaxID=2818968 RepID=UPI002FD3ECEC